MSSIEWTDETWNPTVGCTRISAGCDHCYAISVARRFKDEFPHYERLTVGRSSLPSRQVDWAGNIAVAPPHILNKPRDQKRGTVYFVNSMEAFPPPYVVGGRPSHDLTQYVKGMLKGDDDTYVNPNRRIATDDDSRRLVQVATKNVA